MASPTIDFRSIRAHHGSQHGGFEELICQLAALETPVTAPFQRKGAGADGGLECFRVEADGSETGWQAKYFFELGSGEAGQLKDSFDNAAAKHPALARFIVCLPFDLSDARLPRRKSERQRWNDWVKARQTSIAPRKLEIELWGSFQLTELLTRNDALHVGRRTYWFDLPHFGSEWLLEQFQISRKALGRRYSPELNVELPIRQALAAFARDPEFVSKVNELADKLDEARHRFLRDISAALGDITIPTVAMLGTQTAAISKAMHATPLGPTDQLPLEEWRSLAADTIKTLDRCWGEIWKIRSKSKDTGDVARALHTIERLRDALDRIFEAASSPETHLANARNLLLIGEAGIGKSHLLADVAESHIKHGFPAVLALGGMFIDGEPWQQIAEQLGLAGMPRDAILGALDASAEAFGTRALVIVDALNERNGVAVWADRLAAFLAAAEKFPHIAVLVSCRTTFVPYIVRDLDQTSLPQLQHPGFAGKAADAARRYLDQRGIVRMAAPNFAPEFENPLFLRTCCDMIERRGESELPRNIAGVSGIFDFYFDAIAEALNQRMGLAPRLRRIETALAALTEAMVNQGTGYLSLDAANYILEAIHPSAGRSEQNLLFQLENEGVIAVESVRTGKAPTEMVRFTFERMSDHRIAQRLLETHVGNANPAPAFAKGGPLEQYVAGVDCYQFAGIAEALSVQLPERYGVELIDTINDKSTSWDLIHAFQLSLLWRRQDMFTERTIEIVKEWSNVIGENAVLETLISIATEPDNRFNANYLDRWLHQLCMPQRDVEWSTCAAIIAEDEENPIVTLIEWVLANGLERIEPDRARLAAMALSWLTSLSHRWVRDMATKALATLLVDRRNLAAALIDHFSDVNDMYVVDRVLASAYGAATRRAGNDGLSELAVAAYKAVFTRDPVPTHALVRDHARGIIELAALRGALPAGLNLDHVRPPYPRGAPLDSISDGTIDKYVEDYGGTLLSDQICSSTGEHGDFGHYRINPLAGDFLLLPREEHSRSTCEIYEDWYADAVASNPARVAVLKHALELAERANETPSGFSLLMNHNTDFEEQQRAHRAAEDAREAAIGEFERLLDKAELEEFRIRAAGFVRGRMWNDSAPAWHPTYAGKRSQHWVAWRAHELGWSFDRFGKFDRHTISHGRMEHRVERIGKKYQWIAYHELTGRLSDIALVGGRFSNDPELYRGPWQVGTREMDPTILVTRTKHVDSDKQSPTWWSPCSARWREDPPEARIAWMEDQSRDIPNPVQHIDVTDPKGQRWLVLDTTASRNHLVMVDGERVMHRMTWHKVRSMLVARDDSARLERLLAKSAHHRDHPPEVEMPSDGYLGEYPWHPMFEDIGWSRKVGEHSAIPVHATVADWHVERSGYDYSVEDSLSFTVPSPALIQGLGLRLAEGRSLAYANATGEILFKTPTADEPGFTAALVDRDAMRAFLDAAELDIFWTFTGEKSAHGGRPHGRGWGGMLDYWGVYRFRGDSIEGKLYFNRQNPSAEQMAEFLASP